MKAASTPDQYYASVPTYGLLNGVFNTAEGSGASGLGLQPAYAGSLKSFGAAPVASVDTTSKGVEVELTARILDNWNVMLNVSKTEASRTAISPTIDAWIDTYTKFLEGDAGLLKLWAATHSAPTGRITSSGPTRCSSPRSAARLLKWPPGAST
jgi:hypothetical protein